MGKELVGDNRVDAKVRQFRDARPAEVVQCHCSIVAPPFRSAIRASKRRFAREKPVLDVSPFVVKTKSQPFVRGIDRRISRAASDRCTS
jgi:hypothetical protein